MHTLSQTPTANQILRDYGTSVVECAFQAFPPHLVPERLTTAEQLAELERLNQRDRCPALAPLLRHEFVESGSDRHKQFGVNFHFADGTVQHFAPHTN